MNNSRLFLTELIGTARSQTGLGFMYYLGLKICRRTTRWPRSCARSLSRAIESLVRIALAIALMLPSVVPAQVGAAVERAAQRASAQAVERAAAQRASKTAAEAASRRPVAKATDRVIKRWNSSLCKSTAACPLPAKTANTFVGGSYDEVSLGRDTVLYRAYHDPKIKFGAPGERFTYWSRTDARGVQAVVDRSIPVSNYGNTAERLVAVRVPKGTRVFEGKAQSMERGPIGGGNQVVVDGVKSDWEVELKPAGAP